MAENIETVSQVSDGTELDEPPSEVEEVFETAPEPFVYVRCPAVIKSRSEREEERKEMLYEPTSEPVSRREDVEPGTNYDPSDDGLYVKNHLVRNTSNKSGNKLQQRLMVETGYRFVRESKPFKDIFIDWISRKKNDENEIGNILNKNNDKGLIGASNSSSELVQFEPPSRRFLVENIHPSSLLKHETDIWNRRLRDQERSFKLKPNPILESKNGLMSSDGMTLEQIQEWKRENLNQLDPFDEDNIELLAAIEAYEAAMEKSPGSGMKFYPRKIVLGSDGAGTSGGTSGSTSGSTGYTIRSNQGLEFCSLEEELNKPRNKMLILRSSGTVAHLKNVPVPLNEREVPLHLLNLNPPSTGNKFSGLRGIEAKREKGISILSKLKDQLLLQSQGRYDRPRTLEDLVHEEESTSIL